MMGRRSASLLRVVLGTLAVCAMGLGAWTLLTVRPGGDVRTEDQNHDGRPDVWRAYDRHGRLARVAVDTNFDGRSDVQEFYEAGALVRRVSDRDFNDQIDLVQDFDARTRQSIRSIEDVDFDGTADLLTLYQDGQPVFSKQASPVHRISIPPAAVPAAAPARSADDQLAPLDDPFRGDLAVKAVPGQTGPDDCVELAASCGILTARTQIPEPRSSSSCAADARISNLRTGFVEPYAPRGPPPATLSA
jgi:hypothetical protein